MVVYSLFYSPSFCWMTTPRMSRPAAVDVCLRVESVIMLLNHDGRTWKEGKGRRREGREGEDVLYLLPRC